MFSWFFAASLCSLVVTIVAGILITRQLTQVAFSWAFAFSFTKSSAHYHVDYIYRMYSCSCSHGSYLLNRVLSNQLTDEDISIETARPKSTRVRPTAWCTHYLKTTRPPNDRPRRRSLKMETQVFEKYDGGQVTAGSPPDTKQDHFHHSELPGDQYIRLLRII